MALTFSLASPMQCSSGYATMPTPTHILARTKVRLAKRNGRSSMNKRRTVHLEELIDAAKCNANQGRQRFVDYVLEKLHLPKYYIHNNYIYIK